MLRIIPKDTSHPQFQTCPHCEGRLHRIESLLNTRSDTPVRIFKCANCQRLTWED